MIKNKKLLIIPLLSFLCLNSVYADCTKEEIDAFKEIEDEYKVTYEFDKGTKTYTLNFYNPEPEKYRFDLYYKKDEKTITKMGTNEIEHSEFSYPNISSGEYAIEIISTNNSCDSILKTTTLNLAKYNKYSEDALCQGIEEFVLCQETYGKDIDYETFKSRVETYKKSKVISTDEDNKNNDKEENTITDKIIEYIKINYTKIIIITIFTILVIITVILSLKSLKKSRRLE